MFHNIIGWALTSGCGRSIGLYRFSCFYIVSLLTCFLAILARLVIMLSLVQCRFSFLQFYMLMFVIFANFLKCRGHVVFPHKWLHSVLTCRRILSLLTPCLLARCSSCTANIFCKRSNLRKCLKKWHIQLFRGALFNPQKKKMKKQTSKDISVKLPAIYFTSANA